MFFSEDAFNLDKSKILSSGKKSNVAYCKKDKALLFAFQSLAVTSW